MENEFGWNPATVSAIGAAISVLVVIVAAGFAGWQVLEAKQLREERSRPNVVVDFDLYSQRFLINFVIENLGKTTAYNVRFDFDKIPESTLNKNITLAESTLLKKGIPTLPPGKRIFTVFDFTLDRLQSDLPMTYDVTVTYEGPKGRKYSPVVYTLDLEFYKTLSQGAKTLDDVAKTLEKIQEEISKWAVRR